MDVDRWMGTRGLTEAVSTDLVGRQHRIFDVGAKVAHCELLGRLRYPRGLKNTEKKKKRAQDGPL